jgi:hypothetical protein
MLTGCPNCKRPSEARTVKDGGPCELCGFDPAAPPDRCRAALAELVRLKDGPRDAAYRAAKDAAWQAAREALRGA